MRFYAVRTEAIQHTHRALQGLAASSRGSLRPSRALRVATLYGHLQCRADRSGALQLGLRELAAAWHLQPRLLREDLSDLQSLGWLTSTSGPRGVTIQLQDPQLGSGSREPRDASGRDLEGPASVEGAEPLAVPPPAGESSPSTAVAEGLLAKFADIYNCSKPASWPAYSPRGQGLTARLNRAIRHAGHAEAFWPLLERALCGMPEFWRITYPQGRSGADCAAVLFCSDRSNAGLGLEFWHVFSWGGAAAFSNASAGAGSFQAAAVMGADESEFARADRLLLWDGQMWRGQGVEALKLGRSEKRRLAELLEAAGQGVSGAAQRQYGEQGEA
jgi:hypothetical protein